MEAVVVVLQLVPDGVLIRAKLEVGRPPERVALPAGLRSTDGAIISHLEIAVLPTSAHRQLARDPLVRQRQLLEWWNEHRYVVQVLALGLVASALLPVFLIWLLSAR